MHDYIGFTITIALIAAGIIFNRSDFRELRQELIDVRKEIAQLGERVARIEERLERRTVKP